MKITAIMDTLAILFILGFLLIFLYFKFKSAYPGPIKDFIKNEFPKIFKKTAIKTIKVIGVFLIFFIILNSLIFTPIVLTQLKSKRYPVARAYTSSAFRINQIYIYPLSKIFGYGNFLCWPLYPIKDYLYNTGISKLPPNEGEREIWWFNVRFTEFKLIVEPTLSDSYTYNDKTYKPLPAWQVKSFTKWNEELLSKIKSWPNIKISDPKLKKEKLMRFLDIASTYRRTSAILWTKLKITRSDYIKRKNVNLPGVSKELIEQYKDVINIFNRFKLYSKKNEKDSYEYFQKMKKYEEEKFLLNLGRTILRSKMQKEALTCEDPMVYFYAENWKKLKGYYDQNEKDLKFGENLSLQILLTAIIVLPECKNSQAVMECKEFERKQSEEYKY